MCGVGELEASGLLGRFERAPAVKQPIEIPVDRQAWGLYDRMGADEAAERLTVALRKALVVYGRGEAIRIMIDAMVEETQFGGRDSDVRDMVVSCLDEGRGGHTYEGLL